MFFHRVRFGSISKDEKWQNKGARSLEDHSNHCKFGLRSMRRIRKQRSGFQALLLLHSAGLGDLAWKCTYMVKQLSKIVFVQITVAGICHLVMKEMYVKKFG